jgi:hypothetical protein
MSDDHESRAELDRLAHALPGWFGQRIIHGIGWLVVGLGSTSSSSSFGWDLAGASLPGYLKRLSWNGSTGRTRYFRSSVVSRV